MCVFPSCLPASEHFRSDVGKTKEGSIPPLVYSIAERSDKQVSTCTWSHAHTHTHPSNQSGKVAAKIVTLADFGKKCRMTDRSCFWKKKRELLQDGFIPHCNIQQNVSLYLTSQGSGYSRMLMVVRLLDIQTQHYWKSAFPVFQLYFSHYLLNRLQTRKAYLIFFLRPCVTSVCFSHMLPAVIDTCWCLWFHGARLQRQGKAHLYE